MDLLASLSFFFPPLLNLSIIFLSINFIPFFAFGVKSYDVVVTLLGVALNVASAFWSTGSLFI